MKLLYLLIALVAVTTDTKAQDNIVITGHVIGPPTTYGRIYLEGNGVKEDSATIKEGKFRFSFPFDGPVTVLLHSEYDRQVRKMYMSAALVIDRPGEVVMDSIDLSKGLNKARLLGLKSTMAFQAYEKKIIAIRAAVGKVLPPMPGYDSPEMDQYIKSFDSLFSLRLSPVLVADARTMGSQYPFVVVADWYGKAASADALQTVYNSLSPAIQQTSSGMNISNYLAGLKNSTEGSLVADFSLPDPSGQMFSFSQMKGKYVMIDFWASWCVPCRQSFPQMRKMYERFKGPNFELISISIDRKKQAWDKAVVEEKLPWPQMLDTKSVAERQFAVTAIPTAYLISPEGRIIVKEIGFEENGMMARKLQSLFKNGDQ